MSAFGLANQLAVSRTEAEIFLNNYFERYSAVKKFMSDIVESSKELKYVETLYGRKIHVPNITANNYMVRQAAERAAINGPLQGSAADIIKIAMIKIDEWINLNAPEINMILLQDLFPDLRIECYRHLLIFCLPPQDLNWLFCTLEFF